VNYLRTTATVAGRRPKIDGDSMYIEMAMNCQARGNSGVNGSVTLGDGLTQRGRYPGGRKSPSGVQGRRPNKGSSGRTRKLILILEMDVKLIFYE